VLDPEHVADRIKEAVARLAATEPSLEDLLHLESAWQERSQHANLAIGHCFSEAVVEKFLAKKFKTLEIGAFVSGENHEKVSKFLVSAFKTKKLALTVKTLAKDFQKPG